MSAKEMRIVFLDPGKIRLGNIEFDENERYRLLLLSESIRQYGLIVPVAVRKQSKGYSVVCGERRVRAAILAGVKKIPCIVSFKTEPELYRAVENFSRQTCDPFFSADALYPLFKKLGADKLSCLLALSTKELANLLCVKSFSNDIREKVKELNVSEKLHTRISLLGAKEQKQLIEKIANAFESQKANDEAPQKIKREPLINDKRFYINSLRRIADNMKHSGIEAQLTQNETSKAIEIKIRIKKDKEDELQLSLLPENTAV